MMKLIQKKTIYKNTVTLILVWILCLASFGYSTESPQSIKNIEAFTRLYGYVKYFYPGDEAAALDWERFAVYGTKRVEKVANSAELKDILKELFLPVAPALELYESKENKTFSPASITPPNPEGMKLVTWLHAGVGFGSIDSIYRNFRLNRKNLFFSSGFRSIGNLVKNIDAVPLRGKIIKYKAAVKSEDSEGFLWLRIDRTDGKIGLFDNMGDRPIQSDQWNYYEISGTVDPDAEKIFFGCFLKGAGRIWLDDVQIMVKDSEDSDEWVPISIENPGFEEDKEGVAPQQWVTKGNGCKFQVTSDTAATGKKSVSIASEIVVLTEPTYKFDLTPKFGEYISKELGSGLSCLMPIALQGTDDYTYPPSPKEQLAQLNSALENEVPVKLFADNLYVRLADIVISWNVFQHFYPYFDIAKTDWSQSLSDALLSAYKNKTPKDFLYALKALIAGLKDGHGNVAYNGDSPKYMLPLKFDWVENQLVITDIFDETLSHLQVGDIVLEINGVASQNVFKEKERYISAATMGWMRYRSLREMAQGERDEAFKLKITRNGNTWIEPVHASFSTQQYYNHSGRKGPYSKELESGIYYLDLDRISMDEINKLMPKLETAKAIICDLRGYPNGNHDLIGHLLKEKENSLWMWIPKVVYPDYQQVEYEKHSWNMEPLLPRLTAKIIYITDGRAISYAESYMGYIEGFHLATIVGQPTAGTNGNVNPFDLPGGYRVYWTGMKVVKHDGSQHHGVGIIPNVFVERTIKGIREGRDEFLEKALEIAKQ